MMAQVVINGLTGYLILTGNLSIGVFFSIGNFASLIFSELVVLNQNTTMIQCSFRFRVEKIQRLLAI